jgi:hypothetical protein
MFEQLIPLLEAILALGAVLLTSAPISLLEANVSDDQIICAISLLSHEVRTITMSQKVPKEQLKFLRSFIARRPPFCSGTLPVTQNDLVLYYGKDEHAW